MPKDFTKWFEIKPKIEAKRWRPFTHEREVWWCSWGVNVGSEEDGKGLELSRPVLLFRRFNARTYWAIPITTARKNNPFHVQIDLGDDKLRFAMVQQLRMIDTKRLLERKGLITADSYKKVETVMSQISGSDWVHKKSEATLLIESAASNRRPKPS